MQSIELRLYFGEATDLRLKLDLITAAMMLLRSGLQQWFAAGDRYPRS